MTAHPSHVAVYGKLDVVKYIAVLQSLARIAAIKPNAYRINRYLSSTSTMQITTIRQLSLQKQQCNYMQQSKAMVSDAVP